MLDGPVSMQIVKSIAASRGITVSSAPRNATYEIKLKMPDGTIEKVSAARAQLLIKKAPILN